MKPFLSYDRMRRRAFLRGVVLLGGGIAVLLGGGIMGEAVCGRASAWAFSIISAEKEEAIGKRAHQEILQNFGYYKDVALQAYVTQVGERVLREAESSPFKFQFTVVDHPMVNAFAVPGGFVYVTRGMLAELNSEAELATILGHEIAHVTSHHSAEQMTRALGAQILGVGLAVLSPGGRENAGGWAALSGAIANQILLGYGREAELESDQKGLRWAVKAGYDPQGMINFLHTLQVRYRLSGIGYHALRSTHPETLERIDRSRVMIEILTAQTGRSLEVMADSYKARLDGLVYGDRHERKHVKVLSAQEGESLKDIAKTLWGTENRAWDLALLNGIRDEGRPLREGEKVKIIYDPFEETRFRPPKDHSLTTP